MPGRLTSPPQGLGGQWLDAWRSGLRTMQEQGNWSPDHRQLLDQYVFALVAAEEAREAGRGPEWDRCVKRAMALADQMALTARGRKAAGIGEREQEPEDEFAGL